MLVQLKKKSNDIENMILITWYSSRDFSCKCFNSLQNCNKKNIKKIEDFREFRGLLTAKLLGLSENTRSVKIFNGVNNIAVRKNNSDISIKCVCKLLFK